MTQYKILSDSSCDIPDSLLKEYHIELIPFYVSFDKQLYRKENVELTVDEFYRTLRENDAYPKTSLPSVQDYIEIFTKHLQQGLNILCFCLSSKFSGSFQSAINAKNILIEDYPTANIEIINSTQATAGQGLVVLQAARMQSAGLSMSEVIGKINVLKETARIMFTVDILEYLQKGGRLGKASALLGTILNVKPLLIIKDGEVVPHSKTRGRKKALKEILDMTKEAVGSHESSYEFCILHANCPEDAEYVKQLFKEELHIDITLPFFEVGVTIGTHTGPDALGICFIQKYDA